MSYINHNKRCYKCHKKLNWDYLYRYCPKCRADYRAQANMPLFYCLVVATILHFVSHIF